MERIHFTVDGIPKALMRHRDTYDRRGNPIMRTGKGGKDYNPKRDPSKKDKQNFLIECLNHRPNQPIDSLVVLACIFWMPIPKKNKDLINIAEGVDIFYDEDNPHYGSIAFINYAISTLDDEVLIALTHIGDPDSSNLLKFVEDALEGKFWINDSQIQSLVWKFYSNKPRTEIEILW